MLLNIIYIYKYIYVYSLAFVDLFFLYIYMLYIDGYNLNSSISRVSL